MSAWSAVSEALWLRQFLSELGFTQRTTVINCDNQSAIAIANNPVQHCKMKHIDIMYHGVREHVQDGQIVFNYCPTDTMIADIFTKALNPQSFASHSVKLLHPQP